MLGWAVKWTIFLEHAKVHFLNLVAQSGIFPWWPKVAFYMTWRLGVVKGHNHRSVITDCLPHFLLKRTKQDAIGEATTTIRIKDKGHGQT